MFSALCWITLPMPRSGRSPQRHHSCSASSQKSNPGLQNGRRRKGVSDACVAIVKASFTKTASRIKASVRYIQHRPGRDGERKSRQLFGVDGALTRQEAYELIDEAEKGTIFFRLIISPDPRREDSGRDLDLREITDQAMFALSMELKRNVEYIAAVHDDHAPHRHIHVITLVQGRLDRDHLKLLRETATEASRFQRRERDLAREAVRGMTRLPAREPLPRSVPGLVRPPIAGLRVKPVRRSVYEVGRSPAREVVREGFSPSQAEQQKVPNVGPRPVSRGRGVPRKSRRHLPALPTKPTL